MKVSTCRAGPSSPWRSASILAVVGLVSILLLTSCGSPQPSPTSPGRTSTSATASSVAASPTRSPVASTSTHTETPRPDHIVVVMMENHSYSDVIGNPSAPYINSLANSGASFSESFAITHPSEPNYLAVFSGSTQGLTDDSCPHTYDRPNLATELRQTGGTFVGYSESLPTAGYTGCGGGSYARKHVPWVDFSALPASVNQPFTSFPGNYAHLPTLAFVIPSLAHDMHNGTVGQGDQWLQHNLSRYAHWAATHDSLLVLTWDEDDHSEHNQIPTIITGVHVQPGRYPEKITHYRLLRTLQSCEHLAPIGDSATTKPITDIWTTSG